MINLVHGAVKNAGDFLIFRRCRRLVETNVQGAPLRDIDRRRLSGIDWNAVCGPIVFCGGPAWAQNAFPAIYDFDRPVSDIPNPILPVGVGWSGRGDPETFRFDARTLAALRDVHSHVPRSGVRDRITQRILARNGIDNVVVSGCPAWYDLDYLDSALREPQEIRRIVISNPARPPNYIEAAALLRRIARRFSGAEIAFVFHRGLGPDRDTALHKAILNRLLQVWSLFNRVRVIDASYSDRVLQEYGGYDLHVGYRVHAHIAFLSQRRPSVLIHEDGRGAGQTEVLGSAGVPQAHDGVKAIMATLEDEVDGGFRKSHRAVETMRSTYPVMKKLLAPLRDLA